MTFYSLWQSWVGNGRHPVNGRDSSPLHLFLFYETGINFDPSETRVLRKDGVIVSNSLAAFAYIRGRSMHRSFPECFTEPLLPAAMFNYNTRLTTGSMTQHVLSPKIWKHGGLNPGAAPAGLTPTRERHGEEANRSSHTA